MGIRQRLQRLRDRTRRALKRVSASPKNAARGFMEELGVTDYDNALKLANRRLESSTRKDAPWGPGTEIWEAGEGFGPLGDPTREVRLWHTNPLVAAGCQRSFGPLPGGPGRVLASEQIEAELDAYDRARREMLGKSTSLADWKPKTPEELEEELERITQQTVEAFRTVDAETLECYREAIVRIDEEREAEEA